MRIKASRGKLRVWDVDKNPLDVERIQKGFSACATAELKGCYFSAGQWGCVLDAAHVMLQEPAGAACPF